MNAKETLMEYAKQHNTFNTLTDEQFIGKMVTEGVAINRTPMSRTIARAQREGRTIIVTETTIKEAVDPNAPATEATVEAFRVEV